MINLQNPALPIAQDYIEIDRVIEAINNKLTSNITWLTNGYGRAYKSLDNTGGKRVIVPTVYLGKQGNDYRYTTVTPDNDKKGQCFFVVSRENINNFQTGNYSILTYDVAIIFSVNLELINEQLVTTDYFLQNCVAEVRNCLTRIVTGATNNITLSSVDFEFSDVFSGFDVSERQVLEKSPLAHFRFNGEITITEECITYAPEYIIPDGNLFIHLDAAKGVNSGTPGDGESVANWADQSGNNNDFSQSAGAFQPMFKASSINGLPAIDFTNSSYLERLLTAIPSAPAMSFWIVLQRAGTPNSGYGNPLIVSADNFISASNFLQVNELGDVNFNLNASTNALDKTLAPITNAPMCFGFVKSATQIEYYVNGVSIGLKIGAQSANRLAHFIGAWSNNYFNGYIPEFALYTEETNATKTTNINNYFTLKYNL